MNEISKSEKWHKKKTESKEKVRARAIKWRLF